MQELHIDCNDDDFHKGASQDGKKIKETSINILIFIRRLKRLEIEV